MEISMAATASPDVVQDERLIQRVWWRIMPPQPVGDEPPIRLSEAFVRGLLGGIPQNF